MHYNQDFALKEKPKTKVVVMQTADVGYSAGTRNQLEDQESLELMTLSNSITSSGGIG